MRLTPARLSRLEILLALPWTLVPVPRADLEDLLADLARDARQDRPPRGALAGRGGRRAALLRAGRRGDACARKRARGGGGRWLT